MKFGARIVLVWLPLIGIAGESWVDFQQHGVWGHIPLMRIEPQNGAAGAGLVQLVGEGGLMMAFGELIEVIHATSNHGYDVLVLAQSYYVSRYHTEPYVLWKIFAREDGHASGSLIYRSSTSLHALCTRLRHICCALVPGEEQTVNHCIGRWRMAGILQMEPEVNNSSVHIISEWSSYLCVLIDRDPRPLIQLKLSSELSQLSAINDENECSYCSVYPDSRDSKKTYKPLYILPSTVLFIFGTAIIAYGMFCCPTAFGVLLVLIVGTPICAPVWIFFSKVVGLPL